MRCAVKYGRAIEQAISLAKHIRAVNDAAGRPFELELSIDETRQPTSLAEHYIIADQFRQQGLAADQHRAKIHRRLRKRRRLQRRHRRTGAVARRSCRVGPRTWPLQVEPALGLGQALAVSHPGENDERLFPRENSRHQLSGGAARRGPARRNAVPPRDRSLTPALRSGQSDLSRERRDQQVADTRRMCATSSNSRKHISSAGPTCRPERASPNPAGKCCIARSARPDGPGAWSVDPPAAAKRTTIRTRKCLPIISSGICGH